MKTIMLYNITKTQEFICFLIISICLILVCTPRFNRIDIGIIDSLTTTGQPAAQKLADAGQYISFVKYFRDSNDIGHVSAPFAYRPFVPYMASLLPFDAITSINIINLISLLAALFILFKLLQSLVENTRLRIIGCALFAFSFPTFYYSTIGMVDPVLISFIMLGTYGIQKNKPILILCAFLFGALVKETIIILLPVYLLFIFMRKVAWKQHLLFLTLCLLVYITASYLARELSPAYANYIWWPSIKALMFNITRPRSWLSLLLSFGIPGILCLFLSVYLRNKIAEYHYLMRQLSHFIVGIFSAIAISIYAMFSAHADGRFIWTSYPFSIPMAVVLLEHYFNYRSRLDIEKSQLTPCSTF